VLRRDLLRVDEGLLAERYRAALAAVGATAPERPAFHVDAAGWSPELALDLGDPFYLGARALEAHAVVLSAEQLAAPLLHPSLGFAAAAYREWLRRGSREIAAITLREPLLVELRPDAAPLRRASALADAGEVEVRVRTPGDLVAGARQLEAWKREFLRSDRLWLDDEFIGRMAELASRVRDLPPLPAHFEASRHPLALFFTPAFGGSYVIEERGARASAATTCVLAGDFSPQAAAEAAARPSARGRLVELRPLDPAVAVEILERHRIARLDLAALCRRRGVLERALHWIAVDAIFAREPDAEVPVLGAGEAAERLRALGAPADYLELEEVVRRLASSRARHLAARLAPINRLRLLAPASTRPAVRCFVRHLQAFLDPVDLGRAWCHAPDVCFARWVGLPAPRREHFARWLAAHAASLREERDAE
jgi:hypothetical protein